MIRHSRTTIEEFEFLGHSLGSCELVEGKVCTLSPGGSWHSRTATTISYLLESWARKGKLGRVFGDEAGIVVSTDPDTVRGADVAYFSYNRLPKGKLPSGFFKTPPNLVVEVLGKGQGWVDMVEKVGEYLRMGVDRVWVVDPDTRNVHAYRADQEPQLITEENVIVDAVILPGFSCKVAEFFED